MYENIIVHTQFYQVWGGRNQRNRLKQQKKQLFKNILDLLCFWMSLLHFEMIWKCFGDDLGMNWHDLEMNVG